MSTFWFNNMHFAVEFFGATVLMVAAWLALDAYWLTKEKRALVKVLGFTCFSVWQVLHALDVTHEGALLSGMAVLLAGLLLVLLNVQQEAPPGRPKTFELLFYVPPVVEFAGYFSVAVGVLAVLIAAVSFRRYVVELNKSLRPFIWGFGFLAISFFLGSVSIRHFAPGGWWLAEHMLKAAGFAMLGIWSWQYLQLRLKEQLLLIFVTMSLLVSLVVTFTFSALLLNRMRQDASISLESNARTLVYTLGRLAETAAAKSVIVAGDNPKLRAALEQSDFSALEDYVRQQREIQKLDFVTIAGSNGEVLQRATYRTVRGERLSHVDAQTRRSKNAFRGYFSADMPEGLSVRGVVPIVYDDGDGNTAGFVETGFLLDNVFLDKFKKTTGLDVTLYANDTLYASTIVDIDGKFRPVGTKLSDRRLREQVLREKKLYTGSATLLGKPHLSSYMPLENPDGDAVGIIAVSRPEIEISKAAIATNRLTLFTTLIIVLALLLPAYIVVKKITDDTV